MTEPLETYADALGEAINKSPEEMVKSIQEITYKAMGQIIGESMADSIVNAILLILFFYFTRKCASWIWDKLHVS